MDQIVLKKYQKAIFATKHLQSVPYLRLITLTSSLAEKRAKAQSDVDLLLVAENGHIFTVRYFALLILAILGLKIYPQKNLIKDRVCLSFIVAKDGLDFSVYQENEFLKAKRANWLTKSITLYEDKSYYNLLKKSNLWIKKYLKLTWKKNMVISWPSIVLKRLGELILFFDFMNIVERISKKIAQERLKKYSQTVNASDMVINDQVIKTHIGNKFK